MKFYARLFKFHPKDKHLSLKNKNLIYHQIITIKDQPCEMEICCTIDNVLLVRIEPFELNKTKEYQVICVPTTNLCVYDSEIVIACADFYPSM